MGYIGKHNFSTMMVILYMRKMSLEIFDVFNIGLQIKNGKFVVKNLLKPDFDMMRIVLYPLHMENIEYIALIMRIGFIVRNLVLANDFGR